jgi:hypothetical protein
LEIAPLSSIIETATPIAAVIVIVPAIIRPAIIIVTIIVRTIIVGMIIAPAVIAMIIMPAVVIIIGGADVLQRGRRQGQAEAGGSYGRGGLRRP